MKAKPLISVIMPCYNSAAYINPAIESIISQSFENWELIIIDDGSSDDSLDVIHSFNDPRIKVLKKPHLGVSASRNAGLNEMQGDYFCFLDSDDKFPLNSLQARIDVFLSDETLNAVDGKVEYYSEDFNTFSHTRSPSFRGEVFPELVRHNPACFVGITWMIKRSVNVSYSFPENISHAEDLAFFLKLGPTTKYSYSQETTYLVRQRKGSAMSNLIGLEKGYEAVGALFGKEISDENGWNKATFLKIGRKIMFKSYLKKFQIIGALRMIFRLL